MQEVLIKGGYGRRVTLSKGAMLEVINLGGEQVCDFFAFRIEDVTEALSPGNTRIILRRIFLEVGDVLFSSNINPMFEIVEDTCGVHDIIWPSCDPVVYQQHFGSNNHRSCRVNLAHAVADLGIPYSYLPDPVNLFQNTPIMSDGSIVAQTSTAKAGDKVVLRALQDVFVVASACPSESGMNGDHITDIRLIVR